MMIATSRFRKLTNFGAILKSKLTLPQRFKGGRIEKFTDYMKIVINDYKQVGIDVIQDARDKPFKACVIGSIGCFFIYLLKTNPNENDFIHQLTSSHNNLSEISETIRNDSSYDHVMHLSQLVNEGVLRRFSIGFMSFLYFADYNTNCALYEAQCKYVRPKLISYPTERMVDVGIAGKWMILDRKMIDYDINEDEWVS